MFPPARSLTALILCLCGSGASAAEMVVARSDDPAHAAGSIIDGAAPLQVAAAAMVILIAQDGRTVRLEGPYRGTPDKQSLKRSDSMLETLSKLLAGIRDSQTMAVFRGPPRRAATVVRVEDGGLRCLATDKPVKLGRRSTTAKASLRIASASGVAADVDWPAGARALDWPMPLPLEADARYTVTLAVPGHRSTLEIRTLPAAPGSSAHAVAWMAEQGCERDARLALSRLVR